MNDRIREMVRAGHEFDDVGDGFLLHRDECRGCKAKALADREARSTPEAQEAARREKEIGDRVWSVVVNVLPVGFVLLVVWLAVADPGGLLAVVATMLLMPVMSALNLALCLGGCL